MIFRGLQKLTLLDYPGRVACTLFVGGCNLRCPFCHNATLVLHPEDCESYTEEEVIDFLEKRRGVLDGICITGGEPLQSAEILPFLARLRKGGFSVKLDTNGRRPDLLQEVIERRLVDYIAMDVKNSPLSYPVTSGTTNGVLKIVTASRDLIMNSGLPYEFRTTVVWELHNARRIAEAAQWIEGAEQYFIQNFVDSGDLIGPGLFHPCSRELLEEMKRGAEKYVKKCELRGV